MLRPIVKSLLQAMRRSRLRLIGVQAGTPSHLGPGVDASLGYRAGHGRIHFSDGVSLGQGVVLHAYGGTISLGRDVFLGPYTVIYGHGGVAIGDTCLIAMHCRILSSNHAVPPFGTDIRSQPDELRPTKLGRDVWLGAGVTVLGGVTIGDGCIVGAGAVVTKDLPSGSIAHGVPAGVVGWRNGAMRA